MLHFYDGQIRRYIAQVIRVLSNFTVKYGDGTVHRIPVVYGDADRQAASIMRQNSENVVNSVPRISVYITDLQLDRERLADATYVGNVHIRERDVLDGSYTQGQGRNYTVERLMPTPFKLTMKADIWTANTDQKLQVMEQLLVFFNPSLELQTTDNYIDWTSLTVLNLGNIQWSSRSVPVGADTPIDIGTLTLDTPIWISPPVKVKHLGVITNIITSLYESASTDPNAYIEGLGQPLTGPETTLSNILANVVTTITDYNIEVYNNQAIVLGKNEDAIPREITLDIPTRQGTAIPWEELFEEYPGKYKAGSSTLYLQQPNGTFVVGTFAINPLDPTKISITWDNDTRTTNDLLQPYDANTKTRANNMSAGTFDAIIDPQKVYPGHGMQNVVAGDRFLIVEDIGDPINQDGPDAWKSTSNVDFIAKANDIIEWDGNQWNVIFEAAQESNSNIHQTNIYSGVQYVWNGVYWAKSFEGVYNKGSWRIEL
jgi:hypothetical protein